MMMNKKTAIFTIASITMSVIGVIKASDSGTGGWHPRRSPPFQGTPYKNCSDCEAPDGYCAHTINFKCYEELSPVHPCSPGDEKTITSITHYACEINRQGLCDCPSGF